MRTLLPPVLREFLRFGVVGVAGFLVNVGVTYAAAMLTNLYVAGVVAFLFAAACTWYLNRIWTFSDRGPAPMFRQMWQFLAVNFIGFLVYYGTYATLITLSGLCTRHPFLAVGAGSLAGLGFNFTLSRLFVFHRETKAS